LTRWGGDSEAAVDWVVRRHEGLLAFAVSVKDCFGANQVRQEPAKHARDQFAKSSAFDCHPILKGGIARYDAV
jgi:hypothetical protein